MRILQEKETTKPSLDNTDIFGLTDYFNFGELYYKRDVNSGLHAIIAIHSTKLGPSLGGCRFINYSSTHNATVDVMYLARSMSYKSALADMPLGGGKAVIIKPEGHFDRKAIMHAFGEWIEQLGGRYITAMDSGSTEEDMNIIAQHTKHVASHSQPGGVSGDPSYYTALGVYNGLKASASYAFGSDDISDMRIAIQGLGNVGFSLAKMLHNDGAKLIVSDKNADAIARCQAALPGVEVTTLDQIMRVDCDIFAPCALGHVLNETSIRQLQAKVVAGCANNQLLNRTMGPLLEDRGILYAPDYVINAGGVIFAGGLYFGFSEEETRRKIQHIGARLHQIYLRRDQEQKPTADVAREMAKEILAGDISSEISD